MIEQITVNFFDVTFLRTKLLNTNDFPNKDLIAESSSANYCRTLLKKEKKHST